MSRREKLLRKMREQPGKIRPDEVEALLRFLKFDIVNRRGSHDTYRHPDGRRIVIVRPHGGRTTFPPRAIQELLKEIEP